MIKLWKKSWVCDYLIDFGIAFTDPSVKLEKLTTRSSTRWEFHPRFIHLHESRVPCGVCHWVYEWGRNSASRTCSRRSLQSHQTADSAGTRVTWACVNIYHRILCFFGDTVFVNFHNSPVLAMKNLKHFITCYSWSVYLLISQNSMLYSLYKYALYKHFIARYSIAIAEAYIYL